MSGVCACVCVCCGTLKNVENTRVYVQNVPVCTGTTRTCMKNVGLVPVHTRTFSTYTPRRDRCRHPFPLLPPLSQHTQPQAAHRPQAHRPQAPLLMVTFRQCLQVSALRPYSTQTRIQIMCRHRGCKTTHNTQHRKQKINTYPFSPSLEKWSSRQM